MRKNIFLILVLVAIFAFIGAMNQSAKAVEDPIEIIKNAKTPVHLHSLAGGDSLVHDPPRPTMVCTWWESIYPHNTFGARYHVDNQLENGTPGLNASDWLNLQFWHGDTAGGTVWVHVVKVTITLILKKPMAPDPDTIIYVECPGVETDSCGLVVPPIINSWWHEIWPVYCPMHLLDGVLDNNHDDVISTCDSVHFAGDPRWWHVEDVATDILVRSDPYPQTPTMTQWGMIVLVALIVASAVYILLRRRRATVPA
jgi:hypothetical protein